MSGDVSFHMKDNVVWLGLSEAGPHVVSAEFATKLAKAFATAQATADAKCIVLSGLPKGFPRGLANTETPALHDLRVISDVLQQIEECPLPVVAVIPDAATNEGLELAMAAHYRVGSRTARFGITHIATGLIPGLGGTQRLPRLVGAKYSLELLLNGKLVTADQALEAGLIDFVPDSDFAQQAEAFVADLVSNDLGPRPTAKVVSGQTDPLRYQAQMDEARKLVEGFKIPAAQAIVECIEAAQITPLHTGLGIERSKFAECLHSDEAIALRHVTVAERRLSRPGKRSKNYVSVCILAAKPEDAGLCVAMLDSGLDVTVVDHLPPPHPSMAGSIIGIYDKAVQSGRMTPEIRSGRVARLNVVQAEETDINADVYVDAGRLPQSALLEWLLPRVSDSETDKLMVSARTVAEANDLAPLLPSGMRCASYYFEKPAHIAKLVEIFKVERQHADTQADVQEFFRIVRRLPIVLEDEGEPVSSKMRRVLFETTEALLLNGAEPKQIDGVLGDYGFRQGPLAMRDEAGLEMDLVPGKQPATEALIQAGRTGRKAGLGYFRYAKNDPRPRPDGVVVWNLTSTRERLGIEAIEFTDEEVLALCLGALCNLGAELLDKDCVERASDVDVLGIHSIGFPRRRGGPMQAAEQFGLFKITQTLDRFQAMAPEIWRVHPLIADLVKYGQGFEDMSLPDLDEVS